MTKQPLACIILAAGQGKRMKSALPKALHPLAGRPLIGWLLETVESLSPQRIVVVTGPGMDDLREVVQPHETVVQEKPLGTGDAVKAALPALKNFTGDVLILLGDMPMISADTLRALIAARHKDPLSTGLSVLGAEFDPPPAFGRLVLDANGHLEKIVEDKDCTPAERNIKLCNTGAFCVDGAKLGGWVAKIKNDNAQKEFYITDLVEIAAQDGMNAHVHVTRDHAEVQGVNSRIDLAVLEDNVQQVLRARAMEGGATLIDLASVYFSWDTKTGRDVVIEPNVFFGPGVEIADGAHIRAFSHIEGASIGDGASIGPHARLRPGAVIGAGSKIGNFVEIKNSTLGEGVKVSHLAYIGDAEIGAGTNFSCGAITVNYDGVHKHKTVVGENAMIGSNVNLVAPITIGDGAYIAAGSTITKDVPADALAVAREKPFVKAGWAAAKRKGKKIG
jgi:bifunctional UDP-N-acetylglucosamine pyrophosphorylase/glucosamine-1-phosphate N-acetyltransferase